MQRLATDWRPKQGAHLQSQVVEDRLDDRSFQHGRVDLDLAPGAVRAVLKVEVEHDPARSQLRRDHQLNCSKPAARQNPQVADTRNLVFVHTTTKRGALQVSNGKIDCGLDQSVSLARVLGK